MLLWTAGPVNTGVRSMFSFLSHTIMMGAPARHDITVAQTVMGHPPVLFFPTKIFPRFKTYRCVIDCPQFAWVGAA